MKTTSLNFSQLAKLSSIIFLSGVVVSSPALAKKNKSAGVREVKASSKAQPDANAVAVKIQTVPLSAEWIQKTRKKIQDVLDRNSVSNLQVGISVVADAANGESEVYGYNSEKKFIPASITKIATAVSTLGQFPPGYRFKTQILTTGKINDNGVLEGDLILKGGGDPSFVSENMWNLVNNLRRTGIRKITGDILIDDSLFDLERFDKSRESERVDRAYDAPVGAMSFNWNSLNIFVRPGAKAGEHASVVVDPENEYVRLIANVRTKSLGPAHVEVEKKTQPGFDGEIFEVTGAIPLDQKELVIFKNISKPDLWSGYNLRSFLRERGITLGEFAKIRNGGKTPSSARVLAEVESKPIEHIVADMDKWSNNFVAEMLTKNMAALKETPARLSVGVQQIQKYLLSLNIPQKDFDIVNPSGLTRENKITPHAMAMILNEEREQFASFPEFASSLPIAGIDGTLRSRMTGDLSKGWIRAKTGLLTGVVALAGYAGRRDGHVLSFAFIYNGPESGEKVRGVFDQVAEVLVQ